MMQRVLRFMDHLSLKNGAFRGRRQKLNSGGDAGVSTTKDEPPPPCKKKLKKAAEGEEKMGKACSEAVRIWQAQNVDGAKEGGIAFVNVEETRIQLQAWGMRVEIVLPVGLLVGSRSESALDEGVLAISVDESAPGQLLVALNEKLERVGRSPLAVHRILDLVLQTFRAFATRSGSGGRKAPAKGGGGFENGGNGGIQPRKKKVFDPLSSSSSDGVGRGDGFTSKYVVGGDVSHPICLSEEELSDQSDQSNQSNGSEESDQSDYGYDGFDGLEHTGFEDADFALAQLSGGEGGLCSEVEDARKRCDEARMRAAGSRAYGGADAACNSGTAIAEEDEILKFCTVTGIRGLNTIRIRAEVAGIVSSLKVATALGFTAQGTLQIAVELDEKYWMRGSLDSLKVERVTVKYIDNVEREDQAALHHVEVGSSSRAGLQNETAFAGQATCTTSLLQELVNTFFTRRTSALANPGGAAPHQVERLDLVSWATMKNPIVGLVCFLGSQLKALPGCCVSCWNPLPVSAGRIRTCQEELCLFKFEELGLGAMAVLQEIKEAPELIDFELSAGCAAVDTSRDVFEPFPAFMLSEPEVRGRSGFFSQQILPVAAADDTATPHRHVSPAKKVENKRLKDLLGALQSIPKVEDLLRCTDENELRQLLGGTALSVASSRKQDASPKSSGSPNARNLNGVLSYNLMRFILSTNRLSLLELGSDKLPYAHSIYQFMALCDSPEKEARFAQRKAALKGSFFAFHGSNPGNWYSIMRNGLKSLSSTTLMSAGAAYGEGIYMAGDYMTSYSYSCRANAGLWPNGALASGMAVVAICEVIKGSSRATSPYYVIPRTNEDDVAIRYIIVDSIEQLPSQTYIPRTRSTVFIKGSVLSTSDGTSPTIDLEKHYSEIKLKYAAKLWGRLNEQRAKAMLKLMEEIAVEEQRRHRQIDSERALARHEREAEVDTMEVDMVSFPSVAARVNPPQPTPQLKRRRHGEDADAAPDTGAVQSVAKDFKNLMREIRKAKGDDFLTNVEVTIPDEKNMNIWNISLSQAVFTSNPGLHKDLTSYAKLRREQRGTVVLEAVLPPQYPWGPPFIRIVRPKFKFHTGHVTVGGSICMELLTDSGWLPTFSFESVLVQIVNAIVEGGGRLELQTAGAGYSREEAQAAFTRVAAQHQWKVST